MAKEEKFHLTFPTTQLEREQTDEEAQAPIDA
jgi:hypothetical protein